MLIQSGKIAGGPWAAVEVTSEARIEEIVLHLANWLTHHLKIQPFQLLFPVKARTLEGVEMFSPYLWVRAENLEELRGVKSIMGVQGLVVTQDGVIIPLKDEFIQELVQKSKLAAEQWSAAIKEGSFVRVLIGPYRMLCGKVFELRNGTASIAISLRSREVTLNIPVTALQNLAEDGEYFYKESQ